MINAVSQYPIYGPEIRCPHCNQPIPALTLTDSYLCNRHGVFESDPETKELVHLQSGRHWRQWDDQWYRQHTHPDGIRFEIHEALDRLYTEGFRATKVIIAQRYRHLIQAYFERSAPWQGKAERGSGPRLYGLPVSFSDGEGEESCWSVINFELEKEPGVPTQQRYFRLLD
ncbi:MAG: TIGR02652 family protein [Synechococcales cyanobacterium RM1_1_8]|nr:TIGR02652 family protein [Synechococcales cyanobacterium RM1_1_8]